MNLKLQKQMEYFIRQKRKLHKAYVDLFERKVFGEEIKKVRYAWKDSPLDGLLKNKEGLLTVPFEIEIK